MTISEGGPFDLIFGVPVHPLVVHAAVVLLPIAAVGLVVMTFWPSFSARFGWLVVGLAGAASGACFVAKEAGQELALRVGPPDFDHSTLGSRLPLVSFLLVVAALALWLLDRTLARRPAGPRALRLVIAALALVIAIGNIFLVIRVGHTGARSVWEGVVVTSTS